MTTWISADQLEEKLDAPPFTVIDPRSRMRYLTGHLKGSVNLPLKFLYGPDGRLRSEKELAQVIGAAGLGDDEIPVIYDGQDGRNGAMLAWVLEYLGRSDVHFLDSWLEHWVAEGREIFYRPVQPIAREFTVNVMDDVRARLADVEHPGGIKLIDLRSRAEYDGEVDTPGRHGHIPGAVNLVWQDLVGEDGSFFCNRSKLHDLLARIGVDPQDQVVAYCHSGVRASLGYHTLKELGYQVRLYDGSFQEWEQSGMPVET